MPDNPSFIFPVGNVAEAQGFTPGGHPGIDFSVSVGTPVHASADGTISYEADEPGGYGNVIFLDHSQGFETRYGHLSQFRKANGDTVKQGDVIGLSGGAAGAAGAGNSTGPHLHFEIRKNNVAIDPKPFLSGTASSGDSGGGSSGGVLSGLAAIGHFFAALTEAQTWIRVGEILGGLILAYIGYKLLNDEFSIPNLGATA